MVLCIFPPFFPLFLLVSKVDELSDKEEAYIREVINYHSNAFPNLVMPDQLHQCGFGPDPGNSPILVLFIFLFPIFSNYFIFC